MIKYKKNIRILEFIDKISNCLGSRTRRNCRTNTILQIKRIHILLTKCHFPNKKF